MSLVDLLKNNDEWFHEIWREREEKKYPTLFGTLPDTVIPLPEKALQDILGSDKKILEEWKHYAVIEIPPNEHHTDWLYVTTALSQPWNIDNEDDLNPNGPSGTGMELVLRAPERSGWAVDVLHRLTAYQIGVASKVLAKGKIFTYNDWMPLNGPIDPGSPFSRVRGMLITTPRDFNPEFRLKSGMVKLLQIVGITGDEVAYLLNMGAAPLEELLYEYGAAPVTNPLRESIPLPQKYELPLTLRSRF
jgi:hypothetical protein